MISAFAAGCLAGAAIAIPVGAVGAFIVLLGAIRGWRVGAAAGLGAATADVIYATVAVIFGSMVATALAPAASALRWVSAVILAGIGLMLIRRAFQPPAPTQQRPAMGSWRAYLSLLAVTLVNPTTVVYFVALIAGSTFPQIEGAATGAAFVTGAFVASAAWQVTLATGGMVLGKKVTGASAHRWTMTCGGGIILVLALKSAVGW